MPSEVEDRLTTLERNVEELQSKRPRVHVVPKEFPAVQEMSENLFSGCEVTGSIVDDGRFGDDPYVLIAVVCPPSISDDEIATKAVQWHKLFVEVAPNCAVGLFRLDVSTIR